MQFWQSIIRTALIAAAAAALSACASSPPTDHVAADDQALCRYAAGEPGSQPYRQCLNRLEGQRARAMALSATQIDTTRPDAVALVRPATNVASCRDPAQTNCPPAAGDVTGTIPAKPEQ